MDMLIGLIYDSVLEPALSYAAVDAMRQRLRASSAWLMVPVANKPGFSQAEAFEIRINLSEENAAAYLRGYTMEDPIVEAHLANKAETTNVAFRNSDVMGEAEWTGSAVYRDLCVKADIGHVIAAALVPEGGAAPRGLSFARPIGGTQFSDEDRAYYQAVIPHLLRAARLRHAVAERVRLAREM